MVELLRFMMLSLVTEHADLYNLSYKTNINKNEWSNVRLLILLLSWRSA